MLTFEWRVDSNKCSDGLGFSHFYVESACNPLIEDYSGIFYMITEGGIPSIQCKMSLKGPKSVSKVDGLSLILIDFYVPALTPRLISTETSLHLSENISLSVLQSQKSKLCYDRLSVGQSVFMSSTHLGLTTRFYYCQTVASLLMWGVFSDERTVLPFTIAAGPRQRCYSWVRVPWDSWPYFTVSDSRLPLPGGPGPRIYIPQALGFLFVAFYDSQGYGGGIRNASTRGCPLLLQLSSL
jgi:hypothetical protein